MYQPSAVLPNLGFCQYVMTELLMPNIVNEMLMSKSTRMLITLFCQQYYCSYICIVIETGNIATDSKNTHYDNFCKFTR